MSGLQQTLLIISTILFLVLFVISMIQNHKKNRRLKMYDPIKDIELHKKELENECVNIEIKKKDLSKQVRDEEEKINKLKQEQSKQVQNTKENISQEIQNAKEKINHLNKEIEKLEEVVDMQNIGFYKRPSFEFGTSEDYKFKLITNKEKQKKIVKNKQAAMCSTEWSVDGDRQKGKTMTSKNLNFMIRSFNNECDVEISKVKWNNYDTIKNRIEKSFNQINTFNEPNHSYLSKDFLNLKFNELNIVYHYQEKLYAEKEEQREINEKITEQKRIEQQIKKEAEKAKREQIEALRQAKIAEDSYNKALKDFEQKTDKEKDLMREQLKILEIQRNEAIKIANEKTGETIRIESMAQHTIMGRVYVLSNIGSFGPDICKIGMTRALDPMDRVQVLSGASVPFEFDCHAMIASENAPALESALHHAFSDRRVNLSNLRKEFFRVSLSEVESWLKNNGYSEAKFIMDREARTYYETQALIKSKILELQTKFTK